MTPAFISPNVSGTEHLIRVVLPSPDSLHVNDKLWIRGVEFRCLCVLSGPEHIAECRAYDAPQFSHLMEGGNKMVSLTDVPIDFVYRPFVEGGPHMAPVESNGDPNKTPLGIMPRWLWLEYRAQGLMAAIERYRAAGLVPDPSWDQELRQLATDGVKMKTPDPTDKDA